MSTATTAEVTRRTILTSASREFLHHGFQGGSINRIVEQAGITKGALFHHFAGKKELGLAVLQEIIRPCIIQNWVDPLSQTTDPLGTIETVLLRAFSTSEKEACYGCPLNNLAQEMSSLDEDFRRQINDIYALWKIAIATALQKGIQLGKVRKDVSPQRSALFIVSSISGLIGMSKNAKSMTPLKSAGLELLRYLHTLESI